MPEQQLKILVIDGSEADMRAAFDAWRAGGYAPAGRRVHDDAGLKGALADDSWDLVFCETCARGVKAIDALARVLAYAPPPPFVVLTKNIGDEEMAALLAAGAADVVLKNDWIRLLPVVARELTRRRDQRELHARIAELDNKLRRSREQDVLTGLPNRNAFMQELARAIENAAGDRALIAVELEQLRALNESLGHATCDRLLLVLARQLRALLHEGQSLARVGGGQFAILCQANEADALKREVEKRLPALKAGAAGAPHCYVTVTPVERGLDRHKLLCSAFKPPANPAPPAPAQVDDLTCTKAAPQDDTGAIAAALEAERLVLLFQPVINMLGEPGAFYAARPFVRADDGRLLDVAPVLRDAAQAERARGVDRWLAQRAIDALAAWRGRGRAGVFLALSRHGLDDDALLTAIKTHLGAVRLPPSRVIVAVHAADADGKRRIDALRALKVGLLYDVDAGAFESAPDGGFEYARLRCGGDAEALKATLERAKAAGLKTLVDGIDDARRLSELFALGVDYIQGDGVEPPRAALDYNFDGEQTLEQSESPTWLASAAS